ncbi:MAG: DUF6443 domain-containing protein, partial [Bacteroidota bacterium]
MRIKIPFSILLMLFLAVSLSAQNYVRTYTARENSTLPLSGITDEDKVIQSTQYFDELGRPLQSVVRRGSPNRLDIISGTVYDANGRANKTYLPYVNASGSSGTFRAQWLSETGQFYGDLENDVVDESTYYYSEQVYEASILNRPSRSFGPGSQWRQQNNEKPVSFEYTVNDAADIVAVLQANSDGLIANAGNYATGKLTVSIMTDEDGHQSKEYTDGLGRTVCKKVQSGVNSFYSTYYIYDTFDQLIMVVPPQAVIELDGDWESHLNDYAFRKDWLFTYQYDHRRRMIEKQVPGSEPVYLVYDNRDRLVLTQDGNLRGENIEYVTGNKVLSNGYEGKSYHLSSTATVETDGYFEFGREQGSQLVIGEGPEPVTEWLFTKYDYLNRPVMTGIVSLTGSIADIRMQVAAITDFEIAYSGSTGDHYGYDNSSFPTQITTADILTVTYYDQYNFRSDFNWGNDYEVSGHHSAVQGMVTGSLTRVLGGDMLKTVSYYDDRLRPTSVITGNHLGGTDKVTTSYVNVVSDRVDQTTRVHKTTGVTKTIIESYVYDHMDRVVSTITDVDGQVSKTDHVYNAIGELKTKNLNAAQLVDYEYNIRGWMTKINGGTTFNDSGDKFAWQEPRLALRFSTAFYRYFH